MDGLSPVHDGGVHWLQIIVLINPLIYVNEGLRAGLTHASHMHLYIVYPVLSVSAPRFSRSVCGSSGAGCSPSNAEAPDRHREHPPGAGGVVDLRMVRRTGPRAWWIRGGGRRSERAGTSLHGRAGAPRLRRYTHKHTKEWSATVDAADAFVFVMPEYNYGFTAPLKNAIDFLHQEWTYKPVGFVSYGGVAAGTRAVQMLKEVVTTLKMTPLFEAVSIPFFSQFLDEEGALQANEVMEQSAEAMLGELLRMEAALRPLRKTD